MSEQGWWLVMRPPETVRAVLDDLAPEGLFPADQTWWFAWNALEIKLPRPLAQAAELEAGWDVLRIFSKQAELRFGRRGQQRTCWLLLESDKDPGEVLKKSYTNWVVGEPESYTVETGYHLLAGLKLELPTGPERGELRYPRPLDYGVGQDDLDQALVAEVRYYYDELHRLVTVRYAGLKSKKPGKSIPIESLSSPQKVFELAGAIQTKGGN